MLKAKKIIRNLSGIIAITMLVIYPDNSSAQGNVAVRTIEPHPRVKGRDVWYNVRQHSSGPYNHAGQLKLNFSVDINARTGEYIEVTFSGSVAGNGIVYIKPDVPTGGTLPLHIAGCDLGDSTGITFGEDYNPGSPPYRPYVIKAIYRARGNGTIRFRQVFYRDPNWEVSPAQFWPGYMTAFAEIVTLPLGDAASP